MWSHKYAALSNHHTQKTSNMFQIQGIYLFNNNCQFDDCTKCGPSGFRAVDRSGLFLKINCLIQTMSFDFLEACMHYQQLVTLSHSLVRFYAIIVILFSGEVVIECAK